MVQVKQDQKLSLFNRIILWLHYIVIVSQIIAIAAAYISPMVFWIPAFFGLAFPVIFLINFIFSIYWLIQFKRTIIFGLIAMLMSLPTAYRYLQITMPSSTEQKVFKITSYNSMLFDLYDWKKNKQNRQKILTQLAEINPDILCLQEFYTSEEQGDFNNIDTIKKLLKTNYHHAEFTVTLREKDHWGVATFSKYKIINQGKVEFKTALNNLCIYSDVIINKDTIRVYNIHLQSISFSKEDTKFFEEVVSEKNAEDEFGHSKSILRRLKRAFLKRTVQAKLIADHMKKCPYKIILCGDFNDTAASYAYRILTKDLKDSFIEKGNGLGRTYAGKWPQFRIDYILHNDKLNCVKYERCSETFTDHFSITSSFAFP
ncbi:MAG: endonuclease/exonuclease/phosphatase family protein [Bacteroidetes bacterium]|nr:endonuclease/exonuclease/phosphatase family protein [Bacteroidota bacterium]MCA6442896.1 endonuclease/exonuclease/phosphatase family protein [Bacteroidota bacterium]